MGSDDMLVGVRDSNLLLNKHKTLEFPADGTDDRWNRCACSLQLSPSATHWSGRFAAELDRLMSMDDDDEETYIIELERPTGLVTYGFAAYHDLGLVLEQSSDGSIVVTEVLEGSPAAATGQVSNGDEVVATSKEGYDLFPVSGMALDDVTSNLISAPGPVKLELQPGIQNPVVFFDITIG
eukprot:gene5326-6471_t